MGGHRHTLFSLGEDCFGYVTSDQALEAGIDSVQLAQLARRGTLQRSSYGVYRLVDFPVTPLDPYMAAALWPRGVQGVITHDSALDLYAVSDVSPIALHVTVPRAHRVRRTTPKMYVIHHADLAASDITFHDGIPVTTLRRTIFDCIRAGVGYELLAQAIENGTDQGHLTTAERNDLARALAARGTGSESGGDV